MDCDIKIRKQKQGIKVTIVPETKIHLEPRVFRNMTDAIAYLKAFLSSK